MHQVKPNKYSHEISKEEHLEQLRKVESERKLKLEDFKRRKQIDDWESFREHGDRYQEMLEGRKEQWIDQFNTMREEHRPNVELHRGKFAQRAIEEDQEMRGETLREHERGVQIMQKVKNYNDYVHQHFKPKIMKRKDNP